MNKAYKIKSLGCFGKTGSGVSIDGLPIPQEARDTFEADRQNECLIWADIQLDQGQEWTIVGTQKSGLYSFDFWVNRDGTKAKVWSQAGKDDYEAGKFIGWAEIKAEELRKKESDFDFLVNVRGAPGTGECFVAKQGSEILLFSAVVNGLKATELASIRLIQNSLPQIVEEIEKIKAL